MRELGSLVPKPFGPIAPPKAGLGKSVNQKVTPLYMFQSKKSLLPAMQQKERAMIKNAQEARETIQYYKANALDSEDAMRANQAQGYLAAISGPEVKALAEALEKIRNLKCFCDHELSGVKIHGTSHVHCICHGFGAENALAQYRDAAKEI